MVRPMDDAAFFIPDILTIKAKVIPDLQSGDARRNVDVVCNQQRLSRCKLNDESLVSRSVHIVRQNANHRTLAFDLYVACTTRKRATDGAVVVRRRTPFSSGIVTGARDEDDRQHGHNRFDEDRFRPRPAGDVTEDRCIQLLHDTDI